MMDSAPGRDFKRGPQTGHFPPSEKATGVELDEEMYDRAHDQLFGQPRGLNQSGTPRLWFRFYRVRVCPLSCYHGLACA